MSSPPPATVLDAFGLPADGQPLAGGEGRSVWHGAAVLKPVEDATEASWAAELLAGVEQRGFRLPRPLRARDGRWVVDGWSATQHLADEIGPAGRWGQLLAAGRAFHAALAAAPRPAFLAHRSHRWARADRVAWGEGSVDVVPEIAEQLTRLQRTLRPVNARSQLIHGDLSGNVLFTAGAPPAIIDFSPYWRPAGYADAIVAVDGLVWHDLRHDEASELVSLAWTGADFAQLLVRALIFRLVALNEQARELDPRCLAELALFAPVVERLVRQPDSR